MLIYISGHWCRKTRHIFPSVESGPPDIFDHLFYLFPHVQLSVINIGYCWFLTIGESAQEKEEEGGMILITWSIMIQTSAPRILTGNGSSTKFFSWYTPLSTTQLRMYFRSKNLFTFRITPQYRVTSGQTNFVFSPARMCLLFHEDWEGMWVEPILCSGDSMYEVQPVPEFYHSLWINPW